MNFIFLRISQRDWKRFFIPVSKEKSQIIKIVQESAFLDRFLIKKGIEWSIISIFFTFFFAKQQSWHTYCLI
jgi:hypothetical protein